MQKLKLKKEYQKYSEYKDSGIDWIGKIPKDWNVNKGKNFMTKIANGVWGEDAKGDENDFPCLRVADFRYDRLSFKKVETIRNIPKNQQGRILKNNSILVEKSGGGEKQLVGRAIFFNSNQQMVCANFIDSIDVNSETDPKYFTYLLSNAYDVRLNLKSIKQNTGIQNLDTKNYFNEMFPRPLKNEQEKISKFLDEQVNLIDEIVKKKKKLIELLKEKRRAIINQAVTKGLVNEFMFDTNIFDALLDGKISIRSLPSNYKYYITHIQKDEIDQIKDEKRKIALSEMFSGFADDMSATESAVVGTSRIGQCKLGGMKIPTEAAAWGVSRWDECKWGKGVKMPTESFALDTSRLDGEAKLGDATYFEVLRNGNLKHTEDALIGETSIVNNLVLVSNDGKFRKKVARLGGDTMSFNEFVNLKDDEMKDSGVEWIGKIPVEWNVRKLKWVARFSYGESLAEENRIDGIFNVYGSNGIVGTHAVNITNGKTIIIGRKGSAGKVLFSEKSCFPIDTTFFIDNKKTDNNLKWLFYVLSILGLDRKGKDSAVPGLNREDAYLNIVPLPSRGEQKIISDYLDKRTSVVDFGIAKVEKSINLLNEYKSSLISNVVTGKVKI